MSIKVKAIERNVAFEKGKQKWAFVMQADLYSQLNATKVIEEAAVRSGLPKAVINAGWAAIGDVIAAKQVTSTDTPPTTPSDGNTPSGGDNPSGGSDSAGGSGSQGTGSEGTGSEGSDGGGNMG